MTCTFWSQAGRWEWIVRDGESIVGRSGLVHRSRGVAKTAMKKWLRENGHAE